MKRRSKSLLWQTSVFLGVVFVVGSLVWTFAVGYFLVRPLHGLYGRMLADTIRMVRPILAEGAKVPPEMGRDLESFEVVPDGDSLPVFCKPEERRFPPDVLEEISQQMGAGVDIEQEKANGDLWIRFPAGERKYWFHVKAHPKVYLSPPVLIWVTSGFAVSIGGAYLLIYRISKRLRHISDATRAFGRGLDQTAVEETGPRELQELASSFNQMATDLRRVESERRLMLAGISHDLRTPLTRLRLALEFVESQSEPEMAREMVQDIEEMDVILKQFLDYARDGSEEQPADVNLNDVVREVALRQEVRGQAVGLELGETGSTTFRPLALRRLVSNLVENALRYGRTDVRIATVKEGNWVTLAVSDRGPGVPPEQLETLARPFVQGSAARSELGAGLGLAIVDRIARAHGGRLELSNREGGGFVAKVQVPAGRAEA